MTRVNIVPVNEMTDQHLMAEYREIKHIPKMLERSLHTRDVEKILTEIPEKYKLNTGHVKFFYNKLDFLKKRHIRVRDELLKRNYKLSSHIVETEGFPSELYNDYFPTTEEENTNWERIKQRVSEKPNFYKKYGKPFKYVIAFFFCFNLQASEELLSSLCLKYNAIDCHAVKAVAWVESNFRHVVSENDKGTASYGMLQVKCIAARDVGFKSKCSLLRDRDTAIKYGIKYLNKKIKRYGAVDESFAAYNASKVRRCENFNPGVCYPGEFINHEYVYKAMRRYNYQILKSKDLSSLSIIPSEINL